jgi:hypothetical protein
MISGQKFCGCPYGNALGGLPVRRSLSTLHEIDSPDQQPDRAGPPKIVLPPFATQDKPHHPGYGKFAMP